MSILPDFVLSLVKPYLQPLLYWLSDYIYTQLFKREAEHPLIQLQRHLDFGPLEQACAEFHHLSGPGAPSTHPVPQLVRALLVKYLFDWSLRQLEFQLRFHLVIKWFVGYALFETGPDHTTLERFEQWVCLHHPRLFFDTVLHQIDADFPELRTRPQIGDTFALRADAAKESLLTLIRHTCRRLLTEFKKLTPNRAQLVTAQLHTTALFGAPDEVDEVFLSRSQRQARLQTVVTHALHCAQLVRAQLEGSPLLDHTPRLEILYWLGLLDKILADEVALTCEAEDSQAITEWADPPLDLQNALRVDFSDRPPGAPSPVVELDPAHKGAYRLGSATDPEATYRLHGPNKTDFGYNVQVATDGVFVREIQAATGAQPDAVAIPTVLATQLKHHDFCPEKFIYDRAGGNGKTRALVDQATDGQTQLVAYLPPYDKRTDRFGPEDFTLSAEGTRLTCPHRQMSEVAYRSAEGDGRTFRFFPFQCQNCPLWAACRGDHVGRRALRQVFISDYRPQVEAARAYNQTAEFKAEMKLRPLVERIIAGLVRYNGARRADRRGRPNADFQMKMCATAFNVKTWLRWLKERAQSLTQKLLPAPRPDSAS
ncbi:MAG: transposase [Chloroflexota bacterium]